MTSKKVQLLLLTMSLELSSIYPSIHKQNTKNTKTVSSFFAIPSPSGYNQLAADITHLNNEKYMKRTATTKVNYTSTGPSIFSSPLSPNASNDASPCPQQASVCQEEKIETLNITFPKTKSGVWAIPLELCLQADYTPVTRYCDDNGTWGPINGSCSESVQITNTTKTLHEILNSSSITALQKTENITTKFKRELKAIDVHFISEILDKVIVNEDINDKPDYFAHTINNVIGIEKETLKRSQEFLNSTDIILYSLDRFLLQSKGKYNFSLSSVLINTIHVREGLIGAIIKNNDENANDFTSFETIPLYREDDLNNTDFEVAFIIPPSFIQNHDYYFVTLFYNNSLFNSDQTNNDNIGSWIISILIPEASADNSSTIKIYFKEYKHNLQQQCSHWKYGEDLNTTLKGKWVYDTDAIKLKEGYYVCEVNHTTHFGLLISNSLPDNFTLDLITIFGSVLSTIGIAIIFLTACFLKNWRNNPTNKIILNISSCLLLVIILFFISDRVQKGTFCIVAGILLHYMILVQFFWMLIVSYSNYRRLHLGRHYHIKSVILKYCLVCWGVPLIIVGCIATASLETYDKNSDENTSQICYPEGLYLKLGILLPVSIILSINLIVYILILKTLVSTTFNLRKHNTNKSCSTQKSLILLLFTMGVTWIFGFLSVFVNNILFVYLHCTTSNLHGFILFVFYVLDSTETKKEWNDKIRSLVKLKGKQKVKNKDLTTTQFTSD